MLDGIVGAFSQHFGDMPLSSFLAFLAFPSAMLYLSLRGVFRLLRWWRMIEDVPTSPTRSAHQGYVELVGHAALMDGPVIHTPMSRYPCVWWSLIVKERTGDGWKVVDSEQSDELFYLRDALGVCIVDPEGARVVSMHRRSSRGNATSRHSSTRSGARFRHVERFIKVGDPLYVIGLFKTFQSSDHWDHKKELIEKLRQWKADQPALIKRFDSNQDGKIDEAEWAHARKAARAEVAHEHREASAQPGVNVIGAPADKRPFLIAAQHEQFFTRRLRANAIGAGLAVVIAGAMVLLMIASRL